MGFCTELYKAVHRALSALRDNGVSAFEGEVYTGRIGPIVGTLESVRIIEVSAFQRCPQGRVPLYISCQHLPTRHNLSNTTSSPSCKLSYGPSIHVR